MIVQRFHPPQYHLLLTSCQGPQAKLPRMSDVGSVDIYAAALDSPDAKLIVEENTGVAYANGYLFFTKDGNLVAQPFDPDHLTLSGNPVPVAPKMEYWDGKSLGNFSVSENGVLIYRSAFSSPSRLVWLDRTGNNSRLWETRETTQLDGCPPTVAPLSFRATTQRTRAKAICGS